MKKFLFMVLMAVSFVSFASSVNVIDKDDMIIVVDDVGLDVQLDIFGLVTVSQERAVDFTKSINFDAVTNTAIILVGNIILHNSYEAKVYCPDSYDLGNYSGTFKSTIYDDVTRTVQSGSSGGLAKM